MKKTFTANLNGTVFHIEEDAYDQLQRYLANIRAKFSGSAEAEEIMADIEARIAELFHERLQGRQAISLADVDHVKQVMGQPEDYVDGDVGEDPVGSEDRAYRNNGPRQHKRLYRDPDDRWVGGVLSGLAAYIGTDPLWLRIGCLVFLIAGWGTPAVAYVLMWWLVPQANTAAEKLEMRGEDVTVDNIKRMFEEGTERVKAGGQRMANEAKDLGRQWGPTARRAGDRFGAAFGKLLGIAVLLFAFSLLLGLVTGLIGGSVGLWQATWTNEDFGLFDLAGHVFNSRAHAMWFAIGVFFLVVIPIITLFLAGFRLLLGTPAPRWLSWSLAAVWVLAIIPTTIAAIALGKDFRRENSVRIEAVITQPANGTIYLDMLAPNDSNSGGWSVEYDKGHIDVDLDGIHLENGMFSGAWGELDVEASADSLFHLLVVRKARASNAKAALARAGRIGYDYRQQGDVLLLSPVVRFSAEDKLRDQEVRFILEVPMGKTVFFRKGSKPMLDDIDNITNTYDGDMVGHAWTMTPEGLMMDHGAWPQRDDSSMLQQNRYFHKVGSTDASGDLSRLNCSTVKPPMGFLKDHFANLKNKLSGFVGGTRTAVLSKGMSTHHDLEEAGREELDIAGPEVPNLFHLLSTSIRP